VKNHSFILFSVIFLLGTAPLGGQSFENYFTGSAVDTVTMPLGGSCLSGGAGECDAAMKWFLKQAQGGDVLVLRASGADGYNSYLYSELAVPVNSVQTIVFKNTSAQYSAYIHERISKAEAIWFAGGDQDDYVDYWRGGPIDSLINLAIGERNVVVGGISAGMAILGQYYFSAKNGSVTSAQALTNPYNNYVTVDSTPFIRVGHLERTITDTHYDDPDRKGRHTAFLARIFMDYGVEARGIGADSYAAVCIDSSGLARVFSDYPNDNDYVYFVQTNCELTDRQPEVCAPGTALTWHLGGQSIRAYRAKGTKTGAQTFDLRDWRTGVGGVWQTWSVLDGTLNTNGASQPPVCTVDAPIAQDMPLQFRIMPNPVSDEIRISSEHVRIVRIEVFDYVGRKVENRDIAAVLEMTLDVGRLPSGVYFLKIHAAAGGIFQQKVVKM
jgi:cyanophycinase-like exopeptidase